ncbi:hypothetical protein BJI67_12945 [Acidihalobacter aeolianus]|uniref:Uncharacterized protein n=1 Tax=Acidihalobacter aeolianus TaxID=2792603 RepID=A0A1D8KA37_9GAMM|nr:hypothetical protein [Acidihalobacter aeolianus]AOV17839.1 hypothetical protein BJI67_12945 [Acidihalobacter aeolianus]
MKKTDLARDFDTEIRHMVRAPGYVGVYVVRGRRAPRLLGHKGYFTTTRAGHICLKWSSYYYHQSTIRVEVGEDWIRRNYMPASAARILAVKRVWDDPLK